MGIVAMDGTVAVIGARGDRAASETEPEAFLLQRALRRGQEKTPAGSGWGFFIAETENARLPRACCNTHCNQNGVQASFLRRIAFRDCVLLSCYSTRSLNPLEYVNTNE